MTRLLILVVLIVVTGCDGSATAEPPRGLIPPSRPHGLGDAPNRYDGKGLYMSDVVKDLGYRVYDLEQELKQMKDEMKALKEEMRKPPKRRPKP